MTTLYRSMVNDTKEHNGDLEFNFVKYFDESQVDLPEILYKYRDWSDHFHKRILTDQQLYLASPKDFNDPFDCRNVDCLYLLNNDALKLQYAEALVHRLFQEGFFPEESDKSKETLKALSLLHDIGMMQNRSDNLHKEFQDKYYGILSLSCIWDEILLWSHYANHHRGFCIGFYEKKLRQHGFATRGGRVIYTENVPQIMPDLNKSKDIEQTVKRAFLNTHVKALKWDYEEEYRFTTLFYPDEPNPPEPTIEQRTINIPLESIAEITLGCEMKQEDREEIFNIATNLGIDVYQCIKVPFRYQLDRDLIKRI